MAGQNTPLLRVDPFAAHTAWQPDKNDWVWRRRIYFNSAPFNSTAGTTADLDTVIQEGGQFLIHGAWVIFNQNWTGGTVATATIQVGTTGTPNAYVAATTVFSGATQFAPVMNPGVTLVPGTILGGAALGAATATVRVRLTTTAGNINTLTAGKADICLLLRAIHLLLK